MSPPIQDAFLDIVVMYMTLEIFSRNTDVIMMFLVLYGNHYCTENVQIIQFSVIRQFWLLPWQNQQSGAGNTRDCIGIISYTITEECDHQYFTASMTSPDGVSISEYTFYK